MYLIQENGLVFNRNWGMRASLSPILGASCFRQVGHQRPCVTAPVRRRMICICALPPGNVAGIIGGHFLLATKFRCLLCRLHCQAHWSGRDKAALSNIPGSSGDLLLENPQGSISPLW